MIRLARRSLANLPPAAEVAPYLLQLAVSVLEEELPSSLSRKASETIALVEERRLSAEAADQRFTRVRALIGRVLGTG